MIYKEDGAFLEWITRRLICKFGEFPNSWHILYLMDICRRIDNQELQISDKDLDKILSKYYIDFFLDKTDTCGFTEDERMSMRSMIRNICEDIINKKISNPLIGP